MKGRGPLLASGSIGQNANQRIRDAHLKLRRCSSSSTTAVPLDPNGDFRIDDTLNSVPSDCASPVLLIRNSGGVWFAAGIPKLGDD